jgi:hypothetical protein
VEAAANLLLQHARRLAVLERIDFNRYCSETKCTYDVLERFLGRIAFVRFTTFQVTDMRVLLSDDALHVGLEESGIYLLEVSALKVRLFHGHYRGVVYVRDDNLVVVDQLRGFLLPLCGHLRGRLVIEFEPQLP